MTQQINLYDERLRPRHELATARNLGISALIMLVLVSAASAYVRIESDRRVAELAAVQATVRSEQDRMTALAKAVAERRVTPALAAELGKARALLEARQEVMDVLALGRVGNVEGFSGLMFGFARQAQSDVWLTGFTVAGGGDEIEIRGRMLDPAKLPAYVQRLSSEPVFHGRRFATLEMRGVEPEEPKAESAVAKQLVPSAVPHRYVEFALRSANAVNSAVKTAGATVGGKE